MSHIFARKYNYLYVNDSDASQYIPPHFGSEPNLRHMQQLSWPKIIQLCTTSPQREYYKKCVFGGGGVGKGGERENKKEIISLKKPHSLCEYIRKFPQSPMRLSKVLRRLRLLS